MLFNELNARCSGIKLTDRADTSAAFLVQDYVSLLVEIEKEPFVFLQHIHPYMCSTEVDGTTDDLERFCGMLEELTPYLTL